MAVHSKVLEQKDPFTLRVQINTRFLKRGSEVAAVVLWSIEFPCLGGNLSLQVIKRILNSIRRSTTTERMKISDLTRIEDSHETQLRLMWLPL